MSPMGTPNHKALQRPMEAWIALSVKVATSYMAFSQFRVHYLHHKILSTLQAMQLMRPGSVERLCD